MDLLAQNNKRAGILLHIATILGDAPTRTEESLPEAVVELLAERDRLLEERSAHIEHADAQDELIVSAMNERDRLRAVVEALRTYIRWYREAGDDEDEQQAFAVYAQEGLDMAVRLTEALDVGGPMGEERGAWPYKNWHEFVLNGVVPWGRDELSSEAEDAFLASCRDHIHAVLWAVWFAAISEPLPGVNDPRDEDAGALTVDPHGGDDDGQQHGQAGAAAGAREDAGRAARGSEETGRPGGAECGPDGPACRAAVPGELSEDAGALTVDEVQT